MKKLISLITAITIAVMLVILSPTLHANTTVYSYITDLQQLPAVDGNLIDANNRSKTGKVTFNKTYNAHTIEIEHPNGATYILASSNKIPIDLQLPGVNIENELILESGVLFKGQNNEQLIYYELQKAASTNKLNTSVFEDEDWVINGFRPYVIWDFNTGEYDLTDKLALYAAYHEGNNRRAYVDIVFPIDIDQLLMIELNWLYRYINIFGGKTDWRFDSTKRYADEVVSGTNFWNEFKTWMFNVSLLYPKQVFDFSRYNQETISDLGFVTTSYKNNYVNKINKRLFSEDKTLVTVNDIFKDQYSVQRIYLNTYSAGLYTGYEIHDDIVIADLMYIYKGEYFHPQIEDVEWISVGGESVNVGIIPHLPDIISKFWIWLKEKFGKIATVIAIGLGIIVVAAIFRFISWIKKRLF